jgi:Flp pilus assembly protein TadD
MVAEQDFIAMYYQNLAAEALINKQYDYAYSLLKQGIALNHANPDTLNTLAVLYTKLAEQTEAEKLYRYMLDNDFATANVVANYMALLHTQGRTKEASIYAQQIEKIEDDNPYRWIDMADKAFNAGDYILAEKYYKKANRLAPYIHESQFGLAKAYYQLGEFNAAKTALTQAIEISYRPDYKQLYQAKLQALLGETNL